jgi:hypothetical protein
MLRKKIKCCEYAPRGHFTPLSFLRNLRKGPLASIQAENAKELRTVVKSLQGRLGSE